MLVKAIPYLGLLITILVSILIFRGKKVRTLKKEKKKAEKQLKDTEEDREEIIDLHNDQQRIKEEADAQKQELDETDDSSLVDRANSLFK